jgi:hypothetical protein
MWWPLIILGGPIFWLLFAVYVGLLCWALDSSGDIREGDDWHGLRASALTVLLGLVLVVFSDIMAAGSWATTQWLPIVLLYVPAGVLTGFVKWYFFCHDCKDEFDRGVCEFKRQKQLGSPNVAILTPEEWAVCLPWMSTDYIWNRWVELARAPDGTLTYSIALPRWSNNKGRIGTWMTWWWIVAPWSFVRDFVRRIFRRITELFGRAFNAVATWIWGTLPDPVVVPPKDPDDTLKRSK